MKIYIATSWRNPHQPSIVRIMRAAGYTVYDFRNPRPDDSGFHWSSIDPGYKWWAPDDYRKALQHPIAKRGFAFDMEGLRDCDLCVLVLPCGKSAHLELGWAAGAGKKTAILMGDLEDPELMYLACDHIFLSLAELLDWLETQR